MNDLRTLARIQLALASVGILLAGGGAIWSWHVGDRRGLTLTLVIVTSAVASVVLTRIVVSARRGSST